MPGGRGSSNTPGCGPLSGNYADFWQVTEQALVFAAKALQLDMSGAQQKQLMAT